MKASNLLRTIFKPKPLCSERPGQNNNPLFVEFDRHSNCDCYKINLPWTKYRKHTLSLCEETKGIKCAKKMATRAISEHLAKSLEESMQNFRPQKGTK